MATYSKSIDGYTRWFVKWQPSVLFTSLKPGQKLGLGQIPPTANKVVDSHGNEITSANAPSLNGIVTALEKAAPPTDGTPGQKVQIENADGSVVSTVAKVSDPVNTSAVKTTIDLNVQAAAQSAVNQAPNSSMVVIQPSTGNILAVANNPTGGLDTAMVGHYAPGSTFKTVTTTLVLNKGIISDLNQTWDCPKVLNADGITLHNSEDEGGGGESFLTDFAKSCNNAFSRFEGKVSRADLAQTAHDYYGFDQKWDVGLGQPTVYGHVPTSSSNSLAEELVGQDQITASPLAMASVAATIANGSFKQPILVPGASQLSVTPLPASTDQNLKTLMREAVNSGTLAGVLTQSGVYGKTGTAEVQGKTPNSWTIAVHGDFAVAALAVAGGFGASTAGPECNTLLNAVS
jgi:cell division protein FtsI/penicillin-binding protein 2